MPRPSPRTEGGGYGTQQLDFVGGKPPQVGTPYEGVVVKPSFVGFSGFIQNIIPRGTFGTPSAQPHSNPNVVISSSEYIPPPPEATGAGTTENGCECEACKNGTGQCSDKVPHCNAWDLVCEGTGGASIGKGKGGTDYFFWIKIILVLIGVGVLLWLLRPLFGVAKNITEK